MDAAMSLALRNGGGSAGPCSGLYGGSSTPSLGASPGSNATAASAAFEGMAQQLASDLVHQVAQEHGRETAALYNEIVQLREELQRVARLMEDFVNREHILHEMLEGLTTSFSQATAEMHATHTQFGERAQSMAIAQDSQGRRLTDPLRDTEVELQRINQILATPIISPGGHGWAQANRNRDARLPLAPGRQVKQPLPHQQGWGQDRSPY